MANNSDLNGIQYVILALVASAVTTTIITINMCDKRWEEKVVSHGAGTYRNESSIRGVVGGGYRTTYKAKFVWTQ